MSELSKHRSWIHTQNQEQRSARQRMALFPANAETLFVARDMWVVSTNHLVSLPPPFGQGIQKVDSFFLTGISFSLLLAGREAGRETLRLSRYTELVPEDARWVEDVLAAASPFGTTLPTSDLHSVSLKFRRIFLRCAHYGIISRGCMCVLYTAYRNPRLRRTSLNCRNG